MGANLIQCDVQVRPSVALDRMLTLRHLRQASNSNAPARSRMTLVRSNRGQKAGSTSPVCGGESFPPRTTSSVHAMPLEGPSTIDPLTQQCQPPFEVANESLDQ